MSERKRARDRATEAFRRWARAGCPRFEKIRDGRGAEDLRACAAVFDELERGRRRANFPAEEIERAVRGVYMEEPRRPMRRTEVTMRVRRLACELYVSERMVYFWLARARALWSRYRDAGEDGKTFQ